MITKSPVKVAVTGAAGQIGYSLLFRHRSPGGQPFTYDTIGHEEDSLASLGIRSI
jgi:hypothetical protein